MRPTHNRIGPYELRGELGRGAMARVWRAWDPNLMREVAIKEPLVAPGISRAEFEQTGKRFVAEGRAAARLNHPNIVQVYAAGVFDGRPAIVMELVDGQTLSNMARSVRLEPGQALSILDQLLDAVGYAHANGIVHRDIKPDNIFITRDGRVKLADFGIARVDTARTRATLAGSILGTPGYMSPEQATGAPTDVRGDIFSVGVIAYELLAGRNPFGLGDGSDAMTLLYRVVHEQPAELPASASSGLAHDVRPAIMAALSKNPDDRPQTASAFRSMLVGSRKAPASAGRTPSRKGSRSASRWPPYAALFGVGCILLLVMLSSASMPGGGGVAPVSSTPSVQGSTTQPDVSAEADAEAAESPSPAPAADSGETSAETPAAIEIPSETPTAPPSFTSTNTALPGFVYVSASSSLDAASLGFANSATSVLDNSIGTAWVTRGSSGNGIGEWIEISSAEPQVVSGVEILTGCFPDGSNDLYYRFSRPSSITISFYNSANDQRWDAGQAISLVDEPRRSQDISFVSSEGIPLEVTSIRITIDSVFPGSSDPSCVIGEILVY